jgi:hypothetical protein
MNWFEDPEFRAARTARAEALAALTAATAANPAPGTPDWWTYQGTVVYPARLTLTRALTRMHTTRKRLMGTP